MLGLLRLSIKFIELSLQFTTHIKQALEVFAGAANAGLCLSAALFVFRHASGFFDKHPQLMRFTFDKPGNHPLLDNGVTARAQAGAKENIGDISLTTFTAVEVIQGLTIAGNDTLNGYLVT